jgi:hypothetical protein
LNREAVAAVHPRRKSNVAYAVVSAVGLSADKEDASGKEAEKAEAHVLRLVGNVVVKEEDLEDQC